VNRRCSVILAISTCFVGCLGISANSDANAEDAQSDFRSVLEIAELGADRLAEFSGESDYTTEDWQLIVQLLFRLGQYSTDQLNNWTKPWSDESNLKIGNLYEVLGEVISTEVLSLPDEVTQLQTQPKIFRCQVRNETHGGTLIVLTSQLPKPWAERDLSSGEPVRYRGVLLKAQNGEAPSVTVLLTKRLAWFPQQGVPTGQILLARQGMDVALLDEVIHRKPFVEPSISREGEAFYACLAAVKKVDSQQLASLAQENVAAVAKKWSKLQEPLSKQLQALKQKASTATDEKNRKVLEDQVKSVGRRLAVAHAVAERSKLGVSSVAPLFIQPEQETGELVRLEGIARRAVRIAGTDRSELEEYYELEVFPPDSQDLPVVCCTTSLPAGFPVGDEIRVPVRVSGVFFKSWQYRSRELAETSGETKRQRRLYTPIVVTSMPIWLTDTKQDSYLGVWAGAAFLVVLAVLWISMAKLGQRDREARNACRQPDVLDLKSSQTSGDDIPEIKT